MLRGSQLPRICHRPLAVSSSGPDAALYAAAHGLILDPWQGDILAVPNTLRIVVPDDWLELTAGGEGLQMMPGTIAGIWKQMVSTTPGNGDSMFFQCQGLATMCDMCLRPFRQVQILNVTA